ncbi:putative aspartate kinase II [Chlamydiales bacterium STE3]|nr:putative aspartate kinase II [Chlamydiales bacterium STE3]
MKTLVMKFGGASVATPQHFSKIADIVIERHKSYPRIIIVVSAMGKTTDELIALATQVHPHPPRREYDMLVSVGERISISLLAMALAAKNYEAVSFTGSQSGIITTEEHSEARIVDIRPRRLITALEEGKIVIVAGFQGVSYKGEITTLGRGGGDTSAVALGVAFSTKVEFYKDVPGVFSEDPKLNAKALHYPYLSYHEALTITSKGAKILHPRSIQLAEKNFLELHVLSFNKEHRERTLIHSKECSKRETPIYEHL